MDVANGLRYLHHHEFVHGDLKGVRQSSQRGAVLTGDVGVQANILINSERCACLADFGLLAIIEDEDALLDEGPSSHRVGGTTRWMAPEILDPESYGYTKWRRRKLPSKSTDTYALGMTILEVRISSPLPLLMPRNLTLPV